MAYDGSIRIDTKVDTGGFNSGLSKMKTLASKGAAAITASLAAVSAAVIGGGTAAVKVGSSFESAMDKVSAISGAAGDDITALTEKAKEMGATTKFSASESAEALQYMAMAGWDTEDMLDGISGIMSLAAADGLDLATTSDIVTDALTAFGLQSKDSSHFADVLAKASSSANTNVSMLGESFKYVAPLAGTMGYSVEDVSVALGLMANASVKGSMAGTSLKTALANLSAPTKNMKEVMDKYKISMTDANGKALPLIDVIKELREKFGGLSESEQSAAASTLFGKEAMSGMLAIINASDSDFTKLVDNINNADGAAGSMAETMQDNLQGQITIFKSSLEGLGIELYGGLQEPLKNAAVEAQGYVNRLTDAFKSGNLTGMIDEAGSIFGELAVKAAEYAPKLVDTAKKFLDSFISGISKNKKKLLDSAKKIVLTIGKGITSSASLLFDTATDLIIDLADLLVELAPKALEAGVQLVLKISEGLQKTLPKLLTKISGELIPQLTKKLLSAAPKLLKAALELWQSLISALPEIAKKLASEIPELVKQIGSTLKTCIPELTKSAVSLFTSMITALGQVGVELIKQIPTLIESFGQAISDGFTGVLRGIEEGLSGIESYATKAEKAIEAIETAHDERMTQLEEEKTAIEESKKSWDEFVESQQATANEELYKIGKYEDLIDELQTLIDKNGDVKKGYEERVDFIKNQLSEGLGIEIDKLSDVVDENGNVKKSIFDVIDAKKANIILSQKEALYEEALKKKPELYEEIAKKKQEAADAQEAMEQADKNYVHYTEEALKAYREGRIQDQQWYESLAKEADTIRNTKYEELQTIKEAQEGIEEQLDETEFALHDYETAYVNVQKGNYDAVKTYSYQQIQQFKETGNEKKAEEEKQLTDTKIHSETLLRLYRETGDETYLEQYKASKKKQAAIEESLEKYNETTEAKLKENTAHWINGLNNSLKEIEGCDIQFKDAGNGNVQKYVNGQSEGYPIAIEEAQRLAEGVVKELGASESQCEKVGRNAIWGFINGIEDKQANGELKGWMGSMASEIAETLRKKLEVHSPSRVTQRIGKQVVEGLSVGSKEQAKKLYEVYDDVSDELTKRLSNSVNTDGLVSKLRAGIADGKAMVAQALTAKVIHNVDVNTEEFNRKMILQGDVISHLSIDGREFAVVSAPYVSEELQWNGGRA